MSPRTITPLESFENDQQDHPDDFKKIFHAHLPVGSSDIFD
jgi:hypothetical protein